MAEFLMRKNYGDKYEVISAGTKLSGPEEEIGNLKPAIQEVLDVMNEEGVDVSRAVRKQVTEEMVQSSNRVIAILEDEELPEYLVNSPKLVRWFVVDPKGKDLDETRKIKDQIKELILNMENTIHLKE